MKLIEDAVMNIVHVECSCPCSIEGTSQYWDDVWFNFHWSFGYEDFSCLDCRNTRRTSIPLSEVY